MTASSVVDAGIAARALLPSKHRDACWRLLADLAEQGRRLVAPELWIYEVSSLFCKAHHFGHLTEDEARRGLEDAASLGVELVSPDEGLRRSAFRWTVRLRRAAAYDSFYLALAEHLGCELWTADRKLVRAVDLPWVREIPGAG